MNAIESNCFDGIQSNEDCMKPPKLIFSLCQWSILHKTVECYVQIIKIIDKSHRLHLKICRQTIKLILLYMNPLNVSVNFILSICFVSALFFCRWCCYKCITNDHGINDIWHQFSAAVDPHSDLWPTKYHTLSVSIQSSLNVVVGIINRSWLDTS